MNGKLILKAVLTGIVGIAGVVVSAMDTGKENDKPEAESKEAK